MRRVFWMAVGATVGIVVVRRVSRVAQAYTPEGIERSLTRAVDALRDLADDVRTAMAEREEELRVALGVEPGTMDAGSPTARAPEQRARHVLPDERQLLVRRLLQGGRDRARLGAGHPVRRERRLRAARGQAVGDRLPGRRGGDRPLAAHHRHPDGPDRPSWHEGQLL